MQCFNRYPEKYTIEHSSRVDFSLLTFTSSDSDDNELVEI